MKRPDMLAAGFLALAGALAVTALVMALAGIGDAVRLGAAATSITVVVVGFQAWETRRSTEVARASLGKTDEAIEVSNRLVTESAKARLDARTPHINVSVLQTLWPPTRPPQFVGGGGLPLRPNEEFRITRDAKHLLLLEALYRVTNESDLTVGVSLSNACEPETYASGTVWGYPGKLLQVTIPPGFSRDFMVREARSLADWGDNAEDKEEGVPGRNVIVAAVIFSDTFDNGVIDNWTLEISGYPLERVPDDPGTYRVSSSADATGNASLPIAAVVRPMRRRYFLSKERNEEY